MNARIYCILARNAPVAAVFRRGPSKQVQVLKWNTDTDEFTPGQWLKARIYERRGDLSPNGDLLCYFAANYSAPSPKSSWVAVSRLPYLTALALWFKGDAWCGGGLFKDDCTLALNECSLPLRLQTPNVPLNIINLRLGRGEDRPIEIVRLIRDGWRVEEEGEFIYHQRDNPPPALLDALLTGDSGPYGEWLAIHNEPGGYTTKKPLWLRKRVGTLTLDSVFELHGFTPSYRYSAFTDHELLHIEGTRGGVWADFDQSGRVVFAKQGRLFRLGTDGGQKELLALNPNKFEEVIAPDWAQNWRRA